MRMKTSFQELLVLAWKSSISCKESWLFGLIASFAIMRESALLSPLDGELPFREALVSILHTYDSGASLVGVVFFLMVLRIFAKSNLIVVLDRPSKKLKKEKLTAIRMMRVFFRAAFFEIIASSVFLFVAAMLIFPVWTAFRYNEEALSGVILLSIVTACILLPACFFVMEFSFFYFLLAQTKTLPSINHGAALFSQYRNRSILFGVFYVGLSVAFTFCLNLVMLTIVVISRKMGMGHDEGVVSFLGSFFFIAWFSIVEQALRLFFFKDLASPEEKQRREGVLVAEGAPELPLG